MAEPIYNRHGIFVPKSAEIHEKLKTLLDSANSIRDKLSAL